eukprot:762723-Hanusia_phi.AAC.7
MLQIVKLQQGAQVQLHKKKRVESDKNKDESQYVDQSQPSEVSTGSADQSKAYEHAAYDSHIADLGMCANAAEDALSRMQSLITERSNNRQAVGVQTEPTAGEEQVVVTVKVDCHERLQKRVVDSSSQEISYVGTSAVLSAAVGCIVGYWIASRRMRS